MELAEHFRKIFALDPTAWVLEFEGARYSWGELRDVAGAIEQALADAGAKPFDVVGWVASNNPSAVASMVALAFSEHCAGVLNPHMAPKILCDEIVKQRFPVIVGDPAFWIIPGVAAAAEEAGSAGVVASWEDMIAEVQPYPGLEIVGPPPHREPMPGGVIERLSSGTTGPPKRSPQHMEAIMKGLAVGQHKEAGGDGALTLKRSPSIVIRPLAHAGSFAVLLALYAGRPISLHGKFSVEAVVNDLRRYRPKVLSVVPTMIKMILDADVPAEDLSSLLAVRSGTAPLDPNVQAAFEAKYGVPILIDYGATEFGGVAGWTMSDRKTFGVEKRGSVGRAVTGANLRIVDQETRAVLQPGLVGILEVQALKKSADWISTNDIASIDADGFLYIHGRADDAIVRGGFKVLPDEIANVLCQHPGVQDAAVIGIPDERLGAVPVAVVVRRPGGTPPTEAELKAFARDHLTPYQVPVAYKFTDSLPRTPSMKVVRSALYEIATS